MESHAEKLLTLKRAKYAKRTLGLGKGDAKIAKKTLEAQSASVSKRGDGGSGCCRR